MRKHIKKILIALFLTALFSVSMVIHTRNNGFPYFYHMTEPSKAEQITTGHYNLYHPLLMLNSAKIAVYFSGAQTMQEKVETGRFVSAVYASLTVVLLSLVAYLIAGSLGMISAGVILPFSPMMIRLSHYFKEDPTFLFGLALSFFALALYFRKPSRAALIFVSIAAALASSGKYVGLIMLPIALFCVIVFPSVKEKAAFASRRLRSGIFFAVFIAAFSLANFQVFTSGEYISKTLSSKIHGTVAEKKASPLDSIIAAESKNGNEVSAAAVSLDKKKGIVALAGHGGAKVSHPWLEYTKYFFRQNHPVIPALALVYIIFFIFTVKRRSAAERLLVAFFFLFSALLSLGSVASGQYFLPQEMLSHLFAAFGLLVILSPVMSRFGKEKLAPVLCAFLFLSAFMLYPRAAKSMEQHSSVYDTRRQLASWMKINATSGMFVVSDSYIHLPKVLEENGVTGIKAVEAEFTGDIGSLDAARKAGITHIAVCKNNYGRFFESKSSPSSSGAGIYSRRKNFYTQLFSQGNLVWSSDETVGGVINKTIRLYSIKELPGGQDAQL